MALAMIGVLGCAQPEAREPAPSPSRVDDGMDRWRAIHADGDRPPAGTTAAALVPELLEYLRSPDPARRDGIAYEVLAAWIVRTPQLGPDDVRALVPTLVERLHAPLDEPDGVYGRSFAALALSLVVKRDLDAPFLDDAERRDLLAAARDYAARETDLRGYTGAHGWAHAAAHTADLLAMLAREPAFTDDDRAIVLDAVAALVVRRHGAILHHGEDGRLARPVIEAARRGLPAARRDAWIAALLAPLADPGGADFDPGLYAAQRNARNLLFTLFVQLSLAPELSAGEQDLLEAVRRALSQ